MPPEAEQEQDAELEAQDEELEEELEEEELTGADKLKGALVKERKARKAVEKDLKGLRAELKTLREEKSKREEADLSETDKAKGEALRLKDENEKLVRQMRAQAVRAAVLLKANELGFVKPQQAYRLLDDGVLEDFEVLEDGSVEGVDDALKALAKENKHLLKAKASSDEEEEPPEIGAGKSGRVTRQSKQDLVNAQIERLRATGQYAG